MPDGRRRQEECHGASAAAAARPHPGSTIAVVVVAALLWTVDLVLLLAVVPPYERTFADFGMRVPWYTDVLIAISRWCTKYFYVLWFPLALIVVAVAGSTWFLRHRQRPLGALWGAAMVLLPVVVGLLIWLGCYLPMQQLLQGLQGQQG